MLYDKSELQQMVIAAMKGRSPAQYVQDGTQAIVGWLTNHPDSWQRLGPYFGVVKNLLAQYQPQFERSIDWGDVPDFLSRYDAGSDVLNLVAALAYLNRYGDYLPESGATHSIVMPDESEALFLPGVGIIEH